jgi:CRISPR-associated exonuclease Cas4
MQDDIIFPVSISTLNDYLFCPRRCALHQIDSLWQDNVWTVSGTLAHQHADDPGYESTAAGARIERAVPLFADSIGLVGKADIVEFWTGIDHEIPLPVDYKLGRRHKWDNDDVQLCAQAICLEEMLQVCVPEGAIYHVKTRRRRKVPFTPQLRAKTLQTVDAVRKLLAADTVPPAKLKPQCDGCSLRDVCLPKITADVHHLDAAHSRLFTPGDIS